MTAKTQVQVFRCEACGREFAKQAGLSMHRRQSGHVAGKPGIPAGTNNTVGELPALKAGENPAEYVTRLRSYLWERRETAQKLITQIDEQLNSLQRAASGEQRTLGAGGN